MGIFCCSSVKETDIAFCTANCKWSILNCINGQIIDHSFLHLSKSLIIGWVNWSSLNLKDQFLIYILNSVLSIPWNSIFFQISPRTSRAAAWLVLAPVLNSGSGDGRVLETVGKSQTNSLENCCLYSSGQFPTGFCLDCWLLTKQPPLTMLHFPSEKNVLENFINILKLKLIFQRISY